MRSCSYDRNAIKLVACDKNIRQLVFKDKVKEVVARRGHCPAVFFVMVYYQTVALRNLLEALVVVGIASAGVFNAVDMAVVMDHLVQERSADILDGSGKRTGSDVYLVAIPCNGYPSVIPCGEMPVGAGCGLNCDGWSYKCTFKIVLVEQVKELVEIPRDTVIGRKLFHFTPLLIR